MKNIIKISRFQNNGRSIYGYGTTRIYDKGPEYYSMGGEMGLDDYEEDEADSEKIANWRINQGIKKLKDGGFRDVYEYNILNKTI